MNFKSRRIEPGHYLISNDQGRSLHLVFDEEKNLWEVPVGTVRRGFDQKKQAKAWAEQQLSAGHGEAEALPEIEPIIEASDDEILDEQRTRFDAVETMARMTLEGKNKALIVAGPAGTGKTFGIQMLCEEYEDEGEIRYDFIKGYTRPLGLYTKLYEYREERDVLVIDDCDSVFRDEVGLNLLKVALDTSGRRVVSWNSNSVNGVTVENSDGETVKLPKSFEYKGTIIFLTNVDFDRLINADNRMSPHYEALVSRCHYIELGMKTKREKILRIVDVCNEAHMLENQCGLDEPAINDVLDFIITEQDSLREISLRMALKIGLLRAGNIHKWREMARVTCLR